MSAIHGHSHKVIRHFRGEPAALAVYWIYVSRANYENVAWPSSRGLAHDTGWSRDKCLDARQWLVANKALEEVENYVRPAWRNLPEGERKQKLALDRSEYYRPTGIIEIGDQQYALLYFGGAESASIDDDGLSHRPSTPSSVDAIVRRQNRPELDSIGEDGPKEFNIVPSSSSSDADADRPNIFILYENTFGPLTPILSDELRLLEGEYAQSWLEDAFKAAALNGARGLAYVKKTLKAWQHEGRPQPQQHTPTQAASTPLPPQQIPTIPNLPER